MIETQEHLNQLQEKLRQATLDDLDFRMANAKAEAEAMAGCSTTAAPRKMFSDRLRQRADRRQRERISTEYMQELIYLLDKHPEIARILDLIDVLGKE